MWLVGALTEYLAQTIYKLQINIHCNVDITVAAHLLASVKSFVGWDQDLSSPSANPRKTSAADPSSCFIVALKLQHYGFSKPLQVHFDVLSC